MEQDCARLYPVNDVVPFGPQTVPNGRKRPPMALGHAPGSGGRILGRNALVRQRVGCLSVTFACFYPVKGVVWPQNGSGNGQNRFFPNMTRPFGVLKNTSLGCFEPALDHFEALFGPQRPSTGPFGDQIGVNTWPKPCFSNTNLDHVECSTTHSEPVLRLFVFAL